MRNTDEKKDFWTSLPGIVTAVAGLVTAVGGLILILHQTGVLGTIPRPQPANEPPAAKVEPTRPGATPPPTRTGRTTSVPTTVAPPDQTGRSALQDYDAVQALFSRAKPLEDCARLRRIAAEIQTYADNRRLVPESFIYTVRYPSVKPSPSIGDLATDRILRIRRSKSACFGSVR